MPKKNERPAFTSARGPIEVAVAKQTTPPVTREVDFVHAESSTSNTAKPQAAAKKKGS